MPKTTSATVRLVLLKSARANKRGEYPRGEYPIVLRVQHNGRAEKYTGISVKPVQWDSKQECIKPCKSSTSYASFNQTLFELKHKVLTIRDLYESKGISYTAKDLLTDGKRDAAIISSDMTLSDAVDMMVRSKGLSQNTAQAYRAANKRIKTFVGDIPLSDLDDVRLEGLCKAMKRSGYSDSTINVTMAMVKAVYAFLSAKGVGVASPFRRFKYWKKYRIAEKKVSLSQSDMENLLSHFLNHSVQADGIQGVWAYTDDAYKDLMNRNSELFALACFLLSYQLQGIAFCDLVRIKSENIKIADIDGVRYYQFTGLKRKKTNKEIKDILVEITDEAMPLFHIFYETMSMREGYFLPVLGGYGYDGDKQISEATGSCSVNINKMLKQIFKRFGIDEDATFYSARHSWATHYMMNGGNPVLLADLLGRSVNGIFRYVSGLTSHEQNIRERSRVFGKKGE